MTADPAAIDLEQSWALLLALRQASRTWETLPARFDLGLNGPASLIEITGEGSWVAKVPITEAGAELLDLYLLMALAGRNRPLTVAHLGQSLDGRIATQHGVSCSINGPENLTHLHRMRALCDAIIVGANTVECDNPQLTTRRVTGPHPVRVVLDPRRRLAASHCLFQDGAAPTLLVCAEALADEPGPGRAQVIGVPGDGPRLRLIDVLRQLHQRGLFGVFIEGGGLTVSAFLAAGLLDRLQIAIAPLIIGSGRLGVTLPAIEDLSQSLHPPCRRYEMGQDVLFDCWLR
ncbi:MAG: RibD family protein [Candidatus Competibacteraceae bacterium]|jgi:diaminohydroxyphosphoribosylaminopyrimidine deaminase/5-amino-6-(5-phosphoribosylamino)uracil reductase